MAAMTYFIKHSVTDEDEWATSKFVLEVFLVSFSGFDLHNDAVML